MALEREDVFGEVFDLFGRELVRLAVGVVGIGSRQDVFHCERAAVIEVRGRAPNFDEGGRVELLASLRARADAHVVQLAIRPKMFAVRAL